MIVICQSGQFFKISEILQTILKLFDEEHFEFKLYPQSNLISSSFIFEKLITSPLKIINSNRTFSLKNLFPFRRICGCENFVFDPIMVEIKE